MVVVADLHELHHLVGVERRVVHQAYVDERMVVETAFQVLVVASLVIDGLQEFGLGD